MSRFWARAILLPVCIECMVAENVAGRHGLRGMDRNRRRWHRAAWHDPVRRLARGGALAVHRPDRGGNHRLETGHAVITTEAIIEEKSRRVANADFLRLTPITRVR